MKVGVPSEIKVDEYRVALTPAGARELADAGHEVFVQEGAGLGSAIDDDAYVKQGAKILPDAAAVFAEAEMIVKVKEPQPVEVAMLESRHLLFTYLHLAADVERHPQIVREGIKRGWSWVAHGANNSTWQAGMERGVERDYVAAVTSTIEAVTSVRPRGWLGPVLTASPNTYDILAELDYSYTLDWGIDDEPVELKVATGKLLAVPYSTELNDIPLLNLHGQNAAAFRDALIDQFDVLYAEGESRPRVMGFGIHPFLSGQPFRAKYLAEALAHMAAHNDVWFTTADEIAHWFASTH